MRAAAILLLLGLQFFLYFSGARGADPGSGIATPDLEIVRKWIAGSDLSQIEAGRGHLAKPGYLLVLRILLPHGGVSTDELRRVLLFNALWTFTGIAVLSLALWRREGFAVTLGVAALFLVCLPLRDAADWVATESLAIGLACMFGAALLVLPDRASIGIAAAGASCAVVSLIRPNVGLAFLLVAVVLLAGEGPTRWPRVAVVLLGFAAAVGVLSVVARTTGLPLNPLGPASSKTLFFGTSDYAWPPDHSSWPIGRTPEETRRLELEQVRTRWFDFFRRFGPDERRSLLWRVTHPILAAEELPSRWKEPLYLDTSKTLRRWWWVGGISLSAAAAACAAGGHHGWKLVPALLVTVFAAQGVLFGAEPRFTLPLLPLLFLGIALTLPTIRPSRTMWSAVIATVFLLAAVAWKVPDTIASDYAVAAHPGDVIRQHVPSSRFPGAGPRVLHLRILSSPRNVGLEIRGNGQRLLRRESGDDSPYPPFLTVALAGGPLERARRDGLSLEILALGNSGGGVLYFPVVPGLFGSTATLNGSELLPSGFGGTTRGAFPVWTHASTGEEWPVIAAGR